MSKAGVIALYAKELKLSTFTGYQAVIRQATEEGWGYEEFLCTLLSREAANRKKIRLQEGSGRPAFLC
ncbi:MAG: hypothetical protein AB1556_07010 [Bacillota bacterium]